MSFTFTSSRFAGNATLQEIADDADTGEKKLGPGSDAGAVKPVQQALFDLGWTHRITDPVTDAQVFVIGTYGPITTRTVLAYKKNYDIHFPPTAATGSYDGFAGPRTLQRLDGHCSLLDEAAAALAAKGAEIEAVTGEQFHGPPTAVMGTRGAFVGRSYGGLPKLQSGLWYRRGLGAYLVRAPFWNEYVQDEGPTGPIGYPVGDDYEEDARHVRQDFEWASLRYDTKNADMEIIVEDHVEPSYGISF